MTKKLTHHLLTIVLLLLLPCKTLAQEANPQPAIDVEDVARHPQQYVGIVEEKPKLLFFQGFTLSADLIGPGMYLLGDYGSAEASLRLNLRNTFFPAAELGLARCDYTDDNTFINYKTSAPYLRAGLDFNLLKDKFQDNHLFLGLRYGVSNYNFDISGPALTDPVWGGDEPFSYHDIRTTSQWLEIVVGAQVKVWHTFHMGWFIRYKHELNSTKSPYAHPYYIPGYGITTNPSTLGATYSLIFDLNWGKKKERRRPL